MDESSEKEHVWREKKAVTALCFPFSAGEARGCTWIQLSIHCTQVPPLQPVRLFAFIRLAGSFSVILSTQLFLSSFSSASQYTQGSLPSLSPSPLSGKLTLHCHCPRYMKMDLNLTKEKLAYLGLRQWSRRISSYYGRAMKSYKFIEDWNWKGSASLTLMGGARGPFGGIQIKTRRQNLLCRALPFLWRLFQVPRLCSGDQAAGPRVWKARHPSLRPIYTMGTPSPTCLPSEGVRLWLKLS